eukprot:scaffold4027_cov73-Skeletonema_marinoi.AAC.1
MVRVDGVWYVLTKHILRRNRTGEVRHVACGTTSERKESEMGVSSQNWHTPLPIPAKYHRWLCVWIENSDTFVSVGGRTSVVVTDDVRVCYARGTCAEILYHHDREHQKETNMRSPPGLFSQAVSPVVRWQYSQLETIFDRVKYFMERESGHIIKLSEHINKKDPPSTAPSLLTTYTMTKNDHSSSCSVGVNPPPLTSFNLATPWPF